MNKPEPTHPPRLLFVMVCRGLKDIAVEGYDWRAAKGDCGDVSARWRQGELWLAMGMRSL